MVNALNSQKINEKLYRNSVLYFIKYCNNRYLGKTKLNKLLYYLDFISFRDHQKPVTGDIYLHEEYGPVPAHVDSILANLKGEGTIGAEVVTHKNGEKIKFELKDQKALDESVFSPEQKELLKKICDEFGAWSTDKIVTQTHLEAPWFFSKPLEVVDYSYSKDIEFFRG